uniref:Yellowish-green 1 (Ayg1) n=1 Tax=Kalmanozyma brasiliensis (strain GHG001) TaxID=1365824 RepID=V5GF81_KALBG
MRSPLALLQLSCALLFLFSTTHADATIDDSTDAFITFGQPAMNKTSPYPYHDSISTWYASFLKVARKAFPVDEYAEPDDFAPVFELLQAAYPGQTVDDLAEDAWAEPLVFKGNELIKIADDLRSNSSTQEAIAFYIESKVKLYAWKMDKRAFWRAIRLMDIFDFSKATASLAGDEDLDIPLRVFRAKGAEGPQSTIVIITGLDHYHTYLLSQLSALASYGFTVVVVPMPGTADSPITGSDKLAGKDYWTSIVDWLSYNPELFKPKCVSFWGLSMGSYWAVRVSRVEKDRVKRVVSQGTASHYAFTRTWLEAAEKLAYPFSLQRALGRAFGYADAESFKKDVEKFSLLRQGILDEDATQLIAVNGEQDTIFPIDDQRILAEHGPGALLRWFPHMGHEGEPVSSAWLFQFWRQNAFC